MKHILKHSIFILCILSCVSLSACFGNKGRPLDELQTSSETSDYVVNPGDTLGVTVWGEPRLSGEVFVRDDGRFTLPLINDVPAQGKSLKELSDYVAGQLTEFVPGASVSITVVASAPTRYYLSGSFIKPGEYRSDSKITMLQAIATGGGFAPFADESSITLIRQTSEGEVRYELNYNKVVSGNQPNPRLQPGDILSVK